MTNDELSCKFDAMLDEIAGIASNTRFADIYEECENIRRLFGQPLRIAIIGRTKTGKSTLLNALLKYYFVPTGEMVLTYNVNYMRHISHAENGMELKIYLKNGEIMYKPLQYLESLLDRSCPDLKDLRTAIEWIEVFLDHEALADYDLIDTPGLDSADMADSQNTLDLLSDDNRCPDVIVYLAMKEFDARDLETVGKFQAPKQSSSRLFSGLNTLTAFTRCDLLTGALGIGSDYRDVAERMIEEKRKRFSDFRFCFSKTFAIAAVYAQGAYMITPVYFDTLKRIAALDNAMTAVKTLSRFNRSKDVAACFVSERQKEKFVADLEFPTIQYSVYVIYGNPGISLGELRDALVSFSNVPALQDYIGETYGKYSKLFKAVSLLPGLKNLAFKMRVDAFGKDYDDASSVIRVLNEFESMLQESFMPYYIRRDFYDRKGYFSDGKAAGKYDESVDQWGKAIAALDLLEKENLSDDEIGEAKNLCDYWKRERDNFITYVDVVAEPVAGYIYRSLCEKINEYGYD